VDANPRPYVAIMATRAGHKRHNIIGIKNIFAVGQIAAHKF